MDNILNILLFLLTVCQLKICIKQLQMTKDISVLIKKDPLQKIEAHMNLAEESKDTLRLLKIKYPNINFGVTFE